MTLAILCSGQGRQHSEMFALTSDTPESEALFQRACVLLDGIDPRLLVRQISEETIHSNRCGQIICTLQGLAAAAALRSSLPSNVVFAGYSVGELAAWGAAEVLDPFTTLDLAAKRAAMMDAHTSPGDGLLFIRGLPRDVIDGLCERHGAGLAIVNPDDAFIVGGSRQALHALVVEAEQFRPIRMTLLPVMVASHTKLLRLASAEFRKVLAGTPIRFPPISGFRLLSGVDGATVMNPETGLNKLSGQICTTVQWASCLQSCVEAGTTCFLELGPGDALSRMAREAFPEVESRSLSDFKSLVGVRAWIAARAH
ncbi:malonate decarboxylase subunit epsilon [Rhizobium cauense]|uniref:malonate decarboxylase subunit epsilon n=1 Tax=Rhizobium cauense TaxID=1166683 RepID=UPI001C6E176C|nr:malonate decarboxylase subunit epsilon [Rhizobium cauense]MBW9116856.1 malonate decarboxylase subunit epsilon [Rhizobium cauense]